MISAQQQIEKILSGDVLVASRLIRQLEDHDPAAKSVLKGLFPNTGQAHVIGITGSPGIGKSTITDTLIAIFRDLGKSIGVLAVDPSSPYSGGAILGDRIRMRRHTEDSGVFIRSMATRGALGGLAQAVGDAINVLDAMGKEIIFIETVGTGQQEVDIVHIAQTVLVVLVPGLGDEIQLMKAGILEIADIFVINKAHREGTERLKNELIAMLRMVPDLGDPWHSPVLTIRDIFTPDAFHHDSMVLAENITAHHQHLRESQVLQNRQRCAMIAHLQQALQETIMDPIWKVLQSSGEIDQMVTEMMARRKDPGTLAEEVRQKYTSVRI